MLEIGKTLISLDLITKKFCCDLPACLGGCCVYGDSGAPLTTEETGILEEVYPEVRPYLRAEGIKAIEEQGLYVVDSDQDTVTPLINQGECAFVIFQNGIALCGIEKAWRAGKIGWMKPLSCHLYPVRIKEYRRYDAVNYETWDICEPAVRNGGALGLPVYQFVKDALIRKYGSDWYEQLDYAAKHLEIGENL